MFTAGSWTIVSRTRLPSWSRSLRRESTKPRTAAFWFRRQAHETALHARDAAASQGRTTTLDAERAGDQGLAAHATLGKLELRLDSPDRGPDRYRADVQQVLTLLEGLGDEQGQARAWRLLGLDSYLRCQIGRAEDEFLRAVEHARAAGDQRVEAGTCFVPESSGAGQARN